MKTVKLNICLSLLLLSVSLACTEAYELKTENFESLLVVEATITDELKPQEIKLSKTYRLEGSEPNEVSNAQVWVGTGSGVRINFIQTEPGLYTSENPFAAQSDESYTLNVVLSDGKTFTSTAEILPPVSEIESLNANLEVVNDEQGIRVSINSANNGSGATYYKYEYEETYKIVVPFYSNKKLNIVNEDEFTYPPYYELERVFRTENVETCYTTKKSTDIIQTSLTNSQSTDVESFPVRFIKSNDPVIRERYSILVLQYVQSLEAYNFYKVMGELGNTENIFTDNQPGFIQGNMTSQSDSNENVIGFFEVASVSEKRVYFNYADFVASEPPYFYPCVLTDFLDFTEFGDPDNYEVNEPNENGDIYKLLKSEKFIYYTGEHPFYQLVTIECGDCTSFSSTIVPEFWED